MIAGTQVLRRGAKLDARVGTIERISGRHAYVRWPAPRRIGGEFHHSRILVSSLIPADTATVERRRAAVRAENERRRAESLARFTFRCTGGQRLCSLLQPEQVIDGRCYYCGAPAHPKQEH